MARTNATQLKSMIGHRDSTTANILNQLAGINDTTIHHTGSIPTIKLITSDDPWDDSAFVFRAIVEEKLDGFAHDQA